MTRALRVGILGAGAFASRRHLPDLVSDARVEVAAACRRDQEALAAFADHFEIPLRYGDWSEMLDKADLDAVVIATPHAQHAEQARAALHKQMHVLIEKPMALTASDARELRDTARARGLTICVGFNPPYWEHTEVLKQGIAAGRLGDLESIFISAIGNVEGVFGIVPLAQAPGAVVKPTLFRGDPVENGGGYFMDGGGHLLSELLWVTGRQPVSVAAQMDGTPRDMRTVLSVNLSGGLIAAISAVGNSRHSERRLRSVYEGSNGTAQAIGLPYKVDWSGDLQARQPNMNPLPTPAGDWIDAITLGSEPRGSADHALQVTVLLESAYKSAASGQTINCSREI